MTKCRTRASPQALCGSPWAETAGELAFPWLADGGPRKGTWGSPFISRGLDEKGSRENHSSEGRRPASLYDEERCLGKRQESGISLTSS